MLEFSLADVVFDLQGCTVAFIQDYEGTGWPGLIVSYEEAGHRHTIKAPLAVMHAVQMCAFNFTSLVKKIQDQDDMIEELKTKLAEDSQPADVIPFKPKVT